MSTPEEKTQPQQDEVAKGPLITTGQSSSGMVNNLIPPLGTMYYGMQTHTFLNNNILGTDAAGHFGTVSWNADIYTYGTGGVDPKDPNFAADGGLLYIIMVHRANVEIYSNYSADVWNSMTFSISPESSGGLTSISQLPSTGSESVSGDNYNYSIDFEQAMQMLQNGGNEPLLFDAKYQQSFSLVKAKQSSSLSNGIQFKLNTTGSSNDHRNTEIYALSMFTHKNPSQFAITPGFSFDINGHEHWAIGGGWILGLPF